MVAVWTAPYVSVLLLLVTPSTRALVLEHNASKALGGFQDVANKFQYPAATYTTGNCVAVSDLGTYDDVTVAFTLTMTGDASNVGIASVYHTNSWTPGDLHIGIDAPDANGQSLYFAVNGNTYYSSDSDTRFNNYDIPLNTAVDIRLMYSKSGGTVELYVNGVLTETLAHNGAYSIKFTAAKIGCWKTGRVLRGTIEGFEVSATTPAPTPALTPEPTPSPTPAPTPTPTPAPTPTPLTTSAVGDPHMQNVHGERFDLMQPGRHVLINIPRGMSAEGALLRVQTDARRLGGHCADMYFQHVNVTGKWAEANQVGGYEYSVSQKSIETPQWVAFGPVQLKVVHGHTDAGLVYLNVYVKHLRRAGLAVGGLLGEDDHQDVSTPPHACATRTQLDPSAYPHDPGHSASSAASASFA
mmetsp:Transcript_55328/g.154164  ORF Transcript_55328/g.154164 Transcript_55328/m.154164 type:complete len:412 (+) Transcript_55328:101-1336(+)